MTPPVMTPEQYEAIRESLGWSQSQMARALGVSVTTVFRRERAEQPIDGEAAHAILRVVGLIAERLDVLAGAL